MTILVSSPCLGFTASVAATAANFGLRLFTHRKLPGQVAITNHAGLPGARGLLFQKFLKEAGFGRGGHGVNRSHVRTRAVNLVAQLR